MVAFNTSGIGAGIGDLGGAVSSLFQGFGDEASASTYGQAAALEGQAATIAGEDINLAKTSTAIQSAQAQRQITGVLGGQTADVAGAGFSDSGSAKWLMQDSARQGALTKALISTQGAITEKGFQEQQLAYETQQNTDLGLQKAAKQGAFGSFIGAGLKGIAGIASLVAL